MEFNAGNLYEANKQLILKTEKPLNSFRIS